MEGSKPYAIYRIKQASWNEVTELSKNIKLAFKEHGMTWIKDYFITEMGSSLELEMYTKEADDLLRETVPQYLL